MNNNNAMPELITFSVGITIHNTLEIEAQTKEEAEEILRSLGPICFLEDAECEITRIDIA